MESVLKELRAKHGGMTQKALGRSLGISERGVQWLEAGKMPSVQTVIKVRALFGDEGVLAYLDELQVQLTEKENER